MTIVEVAPARVATRQRKTAASFVRHILLVLVLCTASCVVSIAVLDRPIAVFVHNLSRRPHSVSNGLIGGLAHTPDLHIIVALVLLIGLGIGKLRGWIRGNGLWRAEAPHPAESIFLAALAVIAAEMVKRVLKYAFGRPWPETWVDQNPSFIRDGLYGFFPFHGGAAYGSFPSGHTAAVCAAATVLWHVWPRGRPVYALAVAVAALGLLGMDLHFLSDILAGAFLGWAVGQLVLRLSSRA